MNSKYKSSSDIYDGREWITALNNFDHLYIFGHSLGPSDHMYFEFIENLSIIEDDPKHLTIYYYEEDGKYSIYEQLHRLTKHNVSKLRNNNFFKIKDCKKQPTL